MFCGSLVVPTSVSCAFLSLALFALHSGCDHHTNGEKDDDNSGDSGGNRHGFPVTAVFFCFSLIMDAPFAANLSFLLSKKFGYRT